MEEYLTVKELSERIKLAKQTIYNMIHKKEFVLNKHYYKPKTKIILLNGQQLRNGLRATIQIWMNRHPIPPKKSKITIQPVPRKIPRVR